MAETETAVEGLLKNMENCVFCKIANKQLPGYKVWENDDFYAFLDIEPKVQGMTIVIPKEHHASYVIKARDALVLDLMKAVREVCKLLDSKLENVLRCSIVFEGLDVDHLHAKLLPIYKKGSVAENRSLETVLDILTKV